MVGDVHGDATAFAYAAATDRFVVQLGDLTDYGPDNAGALRIMFRLIDEGRGLFLLGNHDLKLARFLAGHPVRNEATLDATLAQLDAPLRERVVTEVAAAPAWLRRDGALFVHGGFHTAMLETPTPEHGLERAHGALARALYGEPTGRIQPDGYPERSLRWVDRIPPASRSIAATIDAAPMAAPTSARAPRGALRCSSTPAPAREAICHGSTCSAGHRRRTRHRRRDRRTPGARRLPRVSLIRSDEQPAAAHVQCDVSDEAAVNALIGGIGPQGSSTHWSAMPASTSASRSRSSPSRSGRA